MTEEHKSAIDARHLFDALFPDEDWEFNPHLQKTPERWVKMIQSLTRPDEFAFTTFKTDCDEMVIVRDIPFYTLCAHHVLPVYGRAHVAYVPQGHLCGLSKIARAVQFHCAGLNVQEELTVNIAEFLDTQLHPLGVGVIMEAEHLCMSMRGVQLPGTTTTTSCMKGCFLDNQLQSREEFLSIVRRGQ